VPTVTGAAALTIEMAPTRAFRGSNRGDDPLARSLKSSLLPGDGQVERLWRRAYRVENYVYFAILFLDLRTLERPQITARALPSSV
jgi:hypothetical protein